MAQVSSKDRAVLKTKSYWSMFSPKHLVSFNLCLCVCLFVCLHTLETTWSCVRMLYSLLYKRASSWLPYSMCMLYCTKSQHSKVDGFLKTEM